MTALERICLYISSGVEIWTILKIQEKFFAGKVQKRAALILVLALFLFEDLLAEYFYNYLVFAVVRQVFFLWLLCVFCNGSTWTRAAAAGIVLAAARFVGNGMQAAVFLAVLLAMGDSAGRFLTESVVAWIAATVHLGTAVILWIIFDRTRLRPENFSEKCGRLLFAVVCGLLLLDDIVSFGITKGVVLTAGGGAAAYEEPYMSEVLTTLENLVQAVLCAAIVLCLTAGMDRLMRYEVSEQVHSAEAVHYKSLLKEYDSQISLRHDLKNHLISILSLTRQKEYDQLEKYVQRLYREAGLEGQEIRTGNAVIDAIVNIKRKEAEEKKIPFVCEMNIMGQIATEDFDLCILLGNLLDNAISAESRIGDGRERFIGARAEVVKGNLVIDIKNAFYEKGWVQNFGVQNYGTGLWNVQRIVERYGGIMELDICGERFCASVMLPGVMGDRI